MTEKGYKNKVLFMRKSKKGEHLFAFDRDEVLGGEIDSIILNVSEVKALIEDKVEWIKVSALAKSEE